ncbi:unnamed protein product [Rhizoctonia solani]|uniref:F-box domain-containing protein n=1 Tax=Rhizoctonia solani TaxID=456999 RepID=A0A8H3D8B9_9AGAM|nr:unnamed protein product [Rhizoctonia solani]
MQYDTYLPDDIWTSILLLLDVADIRRCQAICKYFRNMVMTVNTLRFRLELDAAGYTEPCSPRQDLTMGQRLAVLLEHISRRRSLAPSRVDTFWDVQETSDPSMTSNIGELIFAGDTVVRWVKECSEEGRVSTRLDVVNLPSPNKGTAGSQWTLYELEFEVYWASNGGVDEKVLCFYVRTLSDNVPHPNACQHTLYIHNVEVENETTLVDFSGRRMLIRLCTGSNWSRIILYDWISGTNLIDEEPFSVPPYGDSLLVDDFLLVAYPSHCDLSVLTGPRRPSGRYCSWTTLGLLEVYSFRLDPEPELIHVATLDLPDVGHTKPFNGPGSEVLNSIRRRSFADMSEFRFQREHAFTSPMPYRAPCVFEVPNAARVVQLFIHFDPDFLSPERGPSNVYSLLIPLDAILRAISRDFMAANVADLDQFIPWEEWGPQTHWIHCGNKGLGWYREPFVTGPRGVLTNWHLCQPGECVCPGNERPRLSVSILELQHRLHTYKNSSTEEREGVDVANAWTHGPLPHLGTSDFGKIDSCLEFREISSLQTTYRMNELKYELLKEISPDDNPIIRTSDEHIIVVKVRNS